MPCGEMVKSAEAEGKSGFEAVGLAVGDATVGSEAVGLAVGDSETGAEAVGLATGGTSVGAEATGLGEEAGVSEVEGVGEELQPTSTISKAVRKP